jgi:ABC-2 type transport system permease protein
MAGDHPSAQLRKLFRLWRVYAHMDLLWITRDIRFVLMCVISDLIMNIGGIMAVFLLAERFDGIGSWTKLQVVFMLGYATAVSGVMNTFFTFNVLHISRRVGRGQLDHTLIQPQPVWLSLLTEGFMPFSGSMPLMAGLGIMAYAAVAMHLPLSPQWVLMVLLQLVASSTVMLAFSFLTGSLAFWAPRAAEEICSLTVDMMSSLRSFPLDGVGAFLSAILLSVLPVGFVAWQPCRSLLDIHATPLDAVMTPVAAVVLFVLAACAFRKGFNHYAATGSQRYLDYGHRR